MAALSTVFICPPPKLSAPPVTPIQVNLHRGTVHVIEAFNQEGWVGG